MGIDEKDVAAQEGADISQYPSDVQEALRQGLSLRMIYRNLLTQYSRVTTPKKDLLAEYVMRAKGPKRSLRQFAEELGVNASTLSRIVNQKTASANSDALIADIAALADKNSGISFEMLMDAHGLANTVRSVGTAYGQITVDAVRSIVMNELLRRGHSVAVEQEKPMRTLSGSFMFDFTIVTNAISRGEGRWGFDVCLTSARKGMMTYPVHRAMSLMRRLSRLGSLYANWDYPYDRVSLVVTDREAYYAAIERLRDCYLKNEITIVLVNLESAEVEDEYLIPWIEDYKCDPVFTDVDEAEADDGADDAWNEMYGDDFE